MLWNPEVPIDLSSDEIRFLRHHGFTTSDVCDCRGFDVAKRRHALKETGKTLALGSPCRRGGHRLRTRSGHCVQCDPAKISYQSRKAIRATLYAARSTGSGAFKIGISEEPIRRIGDLNRETYGGHSDWMMYMAREINDAGKAETEVHRQLSDYSVRSEYRKSDHIQVAREIFFCPASRVIDAFKSSIREKQLVEGGFSQPPPNS
mgnify:CR=1 FL=1